MEAAPPRRTPSGRVPLALRMGVDGLLSFCGSAFADVHASHFSGQTVAVDASGWLHRGSHACAEELALGQACEHEKYLGYALKMVRMLLSHGVTPLCVFDGAPLPMKEATNRRRRQRRQLELAKGRELLAQGRKAEAFGAFAKAVSVTTKMARRFIVPLRQMRLPYLVAPYEADAQLAFLVQQGHCAAAISEDSDLLAYRCPATVYKLDMRGYGRLALYENLRFAEGADRRAL